MRGFRVAYVFDITQTDGDPLPEVAPGPLTGDAPAQLWQRLAEVVEADGYRIERGPCGGAYGHTRFTDRIVRVRDDVSPAQATKTLAHELGHIRAEHDTRFAETYHRDTRCRGIAEVEAESIAYVVTAAAGLDTTGYTVPYVAHWAEGDTTVLRDTAARVITTARAILTDTSTMPADPTRDRAAAWRQLPVSPAQRWPRAPPSERGRTGERRPGHAPRAAGRRPQRRAPRRASHRVRTGLARRATALRGLRCRARGRPGTSPPGRREHRARRGPLPARPRRDARPQLPVADTAARDRRPPPDRRALAAGAAGVQPGGARPQNAEPGVAPASLSHSAAASAQQRRPGRRPAGPARPQHRTNSASTTAAAPSAGTTSCSPAPTPPDWPSTSGAKSQLHPVAVVGGLANARQLVPAIRTTGSWTTRCAANGSRPGAARVILRSSHGQLAERRQQSRSPSSLWAGGNSARPAWRQTSTTSSCGSIGGGRSAPAPTRPSSSAIPKQRTNEANRWPTGVIFKRISRRAAVLALLDILVLAPAQWLDELHDRHGRGVRPGQVARIGLAVVGVTRGGRTHLGMRGSGGFARADAWVKKAAKCRQPPIMLDRDFR